LGPQEKISWDCCSRSDALTVIEPTASKQEKKHRDIIEALVITPEYNHLAHTDVNWWLT